MYKGLQMPDPATKHLSLVNYFLTRWIFLPR
jgi:hypothetical protein